MTTRTEEKEKEAIDSFTTTSSSPLLHNYHHCNFVLIATYCFSKEPRCSRGSHGLHQLQKKKNAMTSLSKNCRWTTTTVRGNPKKLLPVRKLIQKIVPVPCQRGELCRNGTIFVIYFGIGTIFVIYFGIGTIKLEEFPLITKNQ
jgi:hypothetical protein